MVAAVRRLVAVIQLGGQVRRVVGVQYSRAILGFDRPYDPILRSIGTDARGGAGIGKAGDGFTRRSRRQQRTGDRKRLQVIAVAGVVDGVIEQGSHGPRPSTERIRQFLINRIVTAGIELSHVVAIDYVYVRVFARADGKMTSGPFTVNLIGQKHGASGAQILVGVT